MKKVHPTMNENLRDYYSKIQQHFNGGPPQKVQPTEYQLSLLKKIYFTIFLPACTKYPHQEFW
jgi:hypothetical protein